MLYSLLMLLLMFTFAAAADSDFTADGIDDVVVVNLNEKGELQWSIVEIDSGDTTDLGTFSDTSYTPIIGN